MLHVTYCTSTLVVETHQTVSQVFEGVWQRVETSLSAQLQLLRILCEE